MNNSSLICTFIVDDLLMGVDVRHVQEVLRQTDLTKVPLSPPEIAGLINLRGQILTAIDLRKRLSLSARPADAAQMNVILKLNDEAVSLMVDEVGDVLTVESASFESPPDTLTTPIRDVIDGVYKLKDKLLLVLRTDRVFPTAIAAA